MRLWQYLGQMTSSALPRIDVWPATQDHADSIAEMARALSLSDGGKPSRFSAEAFRRDGFGDRPAFQAMIAYVDGEPAGYAVYYWGYDTDSATRGVYLADLYVAKDSRRLGAGRALVRSVSAAAQKDGGRWIFWSVLKRNKGARRFYQRIAPELRDVIICAAFGSNFDRIARM